MLHEAANELEAVVPEARAQCLQWLPREEFSGRTLSVWIPLLQARLMQSHRQSSYEKPAEQNTARYVNHTPLNWSSEQLITNFILQIVASFFSAMLLRLVSCLSHFSTGNYILHGE